MVQIAARADLQYQPINRQGRRPDRQSNDHHRNPEKAVYQHSYEMAVFVLGDAKPVGDQDASNKNEDEATSTTDSLLFELYAQDGLLHFVGHSRVYDGAAEITNYSNHSWAEPAHRALTRRQEPLNRQDAEDHQARSGPGSELSGGDQFRTTDRGLSAGAPTKRRKIAKWIKFATEYDPVISVVPLSLGFLLKDKVRASGKRAP